MRNSRQSLTRLLKQRARTEFLVRADCEGNRVGGSCAGAGDDDCWSRRKLKNGSEFPVALTLISDVRLKSKITARSGRVDQGQTGTSAARCLNSTSAFTKCRHIIKEPVRRLVPQADICSATNVKHYSITSSAKASNLSGMVSPSVFAVPRFITSSNLVGCSTGRSAGFAPSKMRMT